jgi:hypothetical protein
MFSVRAVDVAYTSTASMKADTLALLLCQEASGRV